MSNQNASDGAMTPTLMKSLFSLSKSLEVVLSGRSGVEDLLRSFQK